MNETLGIGEAEGFALELLQDYHDMSPNASNTLILQKNVSFTWEVIRTPTNTVQSNARSKESVVDYNSCCLSASMQ